MCHIRAEISQGLNLALAVRKESVHRFKLFPRGVEAALKAHCIAQRQRVKSLEVTRPYSLSLRANMANIRQSRPDFGLGIHLKVMYVVPSWRGGGAEGALHRPAPARQVARGQLSTFDSQPSTLNPQLETLPLSSESVTCEAAKAKVARGTLAFAFS